MVAHQKDLIILPNASGWWFPSTKYNNIDEIKIIKIVIAMLKKISFFFKFKTWKTFLTNSILFTKFASFNNLINLKILSKKSSLYSGKIKKGRKAIRSINE